MGVTVTPLPGLENSQANLPSPCALACPMCPGMLTAYSKVLARERGLSSNFFPQGMTKPRSQ